MIQTWRFPIILGLSVLFGMPALGDMVLQPQRLLSAGMSYLGALGLSWLGVNGIFNLLNYYAQYNVRVEEKERVEGVANDLLRSAGPAPTASTNAAANGSGVSPAPARTAAPATTTSAAPATTGSGGEGQDAPARRPVATDLLAEDDTVGAAI